VTQAITQHETTAADGTRLYYETSGVEDSSASTILLCDGIGCDGFVWKYLQPWLATQYKVVHSHYRGHGQSGFASDEANYTIGHIVDDLMCVLDAADVPTATLIGHSMGVQVSIEAALTAPKRVDGLALLCGSFGRPLDTFHDHSMLKLALPVVAKAVDRFNHLLKPVVRTLMPTDLGWQIAKRTEVDPKMLKREDFLPYLEHLSRMDYRIFVRILAAAAAHTTEDRLHLVEQPALVVGGEKDRFTPYWVSEVLGDRLPRATLQMVRGGTHTAPLEHQRLMEMWLGDFLATSGLSASSGDAVPAGAL
jgi:pimeloyl-ACP methyl ester carboxylesterase